MTLTEQIHNAAVEAKERKADAQAQTADQRVQVTGQAYTDKPFDPRCGLDIDFSNEVFDKDPYRRVIHENKED